MQCPECKISSIPPGATRCPVCGFPAHKMKPSIDHPQAPESKSETPKQKNIKDCAPCAKRGRVKQNKAILFCILLCLAIYAFSLLFSHPKQKTPQQLNLKARAL